jgi:nicotinate-nucleotide pyrophosphorylase (carboxylating)
MELLSQLELVELVRRALAEDIGHGDVTTAATVAPGQRGRARITVKQDDVVFCGGPVLDRVLREAGASPHLERIVPEGARCKRGDVVAEISGDMAGLLIGERTALNFLQLMSGIATLTRRYVDAITGTAAKIIDTRKTHPGLRAVEKYAVRIGGGTNHRFGLDAGVLIKENHIVAAGSISAAIERCRQLAPHTLQIEVECETLDQVAEAVRARAGLVLLDNMSPDDMRRARELAGDGLLLEASGGVRLETVRQIAESGVDLISVGALTHSAPAADLSMRIEASS